MADLRDTSINIVSNIHQAQLYFSEKDQQRIEKIEKVYQKLKQEAKNCTIYKQADLPKKWHYNFKERIGDVIVVADPPYMVGSLLALNKIKKGFSLGQHGYDGYKHKQMHGIFYAWGHHIKPNKTIRSFENVHIYPLIAHILKLKTPKNIDGKLRILKNITKK